MMVVLPHERDGALRRQVIEGTVRANPGIHKSDLCRRTGLAWGTIDYHVRRLEQAGRLRRHQHEGGVRYFTTDFASSALLTKVLGAAGAWQVLQALQAQGPLGPADLCRQLQVGRRLVVMRLRWLEAIGAVVGGAQYHRRYRISPQGADALRERSALPQEVVTSPDVGSVAA